MFTFEILNTWIVTQFTRFFVFFPSDGSAGYGVGVSRDAPGGYGGMFELIVFGEYA